MHIDSWYFKDLVLVSISKKKAECVKTLLTENSTAKIYEAQGKYEGLQIAEDRITTDFGPVEGTMLREDLPDISVLSRSALENFAGDIDNHREQWVAISEFMGGQEEKEKSELFEGNSLVNRDFKRAHGKRDGMRDFEKLMDKITQTLTEAKENPTLFDVDPEEEAEVVEFPQAEFEDLDQEADEKIDSYMEGEDPVEEYTGESVEDMAVDSEEYDDENWSGEEIL